MPFDVVKFCLDTQILHSEQELLPHFDLKKTEKKLDNVPLEMILLLRKAI